MNKEEKLAYLDKLVEPQGNESGMSVAPLLREMIEDAGDQVEVDDAIEAAKEAQETAEAAEAAATAAGTAAQEANTAAQNAQKTADEALQAAQNAGVGKPGTGTNSEIFNDYENNEASEDYSHSEGRYTHAVGVCSHAEGNLTRASHYSHAEGYNSNASGGNSHAEGNLPTKRKHGGLYMPSIYLLICYLCFEYKHTIYDSNIGRRPRKGHTRQTLPRMAGREAAL